ncbi:MAG: protein arginine kinase [Candidatus Latescibacteria bacterium]|jgi:protein arginine kinase|nr:protein arginine kinase [Candidatus Latescibacterota bacterium]
MTFDDLASRSACWLNGSGDCSALVVSSRVRLARNLAQWPFPHRATIEQRQKVVEAVVGSCGDALQAFFQTGSLSHLQRNLLVERHLISPALIKRENQCGVIVGDDGHLSAMVNEEDHLRLQGIFPGLQPRAAWNAACGLERFFADRLNFAFSDAWGYLTACPTNTGTGLRASVLIHLPGLVLTQDVDAVVRGITQMGFVVRGFFGEGTDTAGNMFQVSNQITLGRSESELLDLLDQVVAQLTVCENNARETLWRDAQTKIEDKIWRALGLLKYARLLTSQEFMNLSSAVRLGVGMGVLDSVSVRTLNELMVETQPAHLQYRTKQRLDAHTRDVLRAEWVRQRLVSS